MRRPRQPPPVTSARPRCGNGRRLARRALAGRGRRGLFGQAQPRALRPRRPPPRRRRPCGACASPARRLLPRRQPPRGRPRRLAALVVRRRLGAAGASPSAAVRQGLVLISGVVHAGSVLGLRGRKVGGIGRNRDRGVRGYRRCRTGSATAPAGRQAPRPARARAPRQVAPRARGSRFGRAPRRAPPRRRPATGPATPRRPAATRCRLSSAGSCSRLARPRSSRKALVVAYSAGRPGVSRVADGVDPAAVLELLDDLAGHDDTADVLDVAARDGLAVSNDGQRLQHGARIARRLLGMQPVEVLAQLGPALEAPARGQRHQLHALAGPVAAQVVEQAAHTCRRRVRRRTGCASRATSAAARHRSARFRGRAWHPGYS